MTTKSKTTEPIAELLKAMPTDDELREIHAGEILSFNDVTRAEAEAIDARCNNFLHRLDDAIGKVSDDASAP